MRRKFTIDHRTSQIILTYVASLLNPSNYLMKAADVDCTPCPTTSESPHLGLSTRELSSSPHPASALWSLGCCTALSTQHSLHFIAKT